LWEINPKNAQPLNFLNGATAPTEPRPPHSRGYMITLSFTNHTRQDSSGGVISKTRKFLPDNKQHTQEVHIRATGDIRTNSHSK
jgi:hypothetical protein